VIHPGPKKPAAPNPSRLRLSCKLVVTGAGSVSQSVRLYLSREKIPRHNTGDRVSGGFHTRTGCDGAIEQTRPRLVGIAAAPYYRYA